MELLQIKKKDLSVKLTVFGCKKKKSKLYPVSLLRKRTNRTMKYVEEYNALLEAGDQKFYR